MSQTTIRPPDDLAPQINLRNLLWVGFALVVLAAAVQIESAWLLNFIHVLSGLLWTGIDLFMGFVIGPIMRRLPPPARRAMILRLMPKMLFLMPTLSILTGVAGWYHARMIGLLDVPWPSYGWVLAALVIISLLTIQGLGVLLPTNLMVYFEMRKPSPDAHRVGRLMRRYIGFVALQGIMQIGIIIVMARFVTGL
ncbi:MAG: hypothetical protein KGJ41_12300 [Rhodospirillales bacterium]|nr:hypothetical protein [Rhodospirillales bacterium]MDE2574157.1 hypothetical protein [Rhodospirillales bacterium]